MAGIDFRKVESAEEENLKSILREEEVERQKMTWRQRLARQLKNKVIRSHDFLDNDFEVEDSSKDRPKIAVYSCITGGYDRVIEPEFEFENIDYILFTDGKIKSEKWEVREIPENCRQENAALSNRYVKMHPHEIFANEYDYSIYVDGNLKVVGDLTPMAYAVSKIGLAFHRHSMRDDIRKEVYACIAQKKGDKKKLLEQLRRYKLEGFPKKYGMLECNVIVTKLDSEVAERILGAWWEEFVRSGSMRDQIALPYVLWKMGYTIEDVGNLGYNVYRNPKLRKLEHRK